jgi:hypothetical protein
MKNFWILSAIISFVLICSCQKQDSAAEQELAQRKTELDARENRLDERMNELGEKVKALDERVKTPWRTQGQALTAFRAKLPTPHRNKQKERGYNSFTPRCEPGWPTPRSGALQELRKRGERKSDLLKGSSRRNNYRAKSSVSRRCLAAQYFLHRQLHLPQ